MPGSEMSSATLMPGLLATALSAMGPTPTSAVIDASAGTVHCCRAAVTLIDARKHAEYPAANSCSGLVPGVPSPPSSLGTVRVSPSMPSDEWE